MQYTLTIKSKEVDLRDRMNWLRCRGFVEDMFPRYSTLICVNGKIKLTLNKGCAASLSDNIRDRIKKLERASEFDLKVVGISSDSEEYPDIIFKIESALRLREGRPLMTKRIKIFLKSIS